VQLSGLPPELFDAPGPAAGGADGEGGASGSPPPPASNKAKGRWRRKVVTPSMTEALKRSLLVAERNKHVTAERVLRQRLEEAATRLAEGLGQEDEGPLSDSEASPRDFMRTGELEEEGKG
jgi:hypothetical protein